MVRDRLALELEGVDDVGDKLEVGFDFGKLFGFVEAFERSGRLERIFAVLNRDVEKVAGEAEKNALFVCLGEALGAVEKSGVEKVERLETVFGIGLEQFVKHWRLEGDAAKLPAVFLVAKPGRMETFANDSKTEAKLFLELKNQVAPAEDGGLGSVAFAVGVFFGNVDVGLGKVDIFVGAGNEVVGAIVVAGVDHAGLGDSVEWQAGGGMVEAGKSFRESFGDKILAIGRLVTFALFAGDE